LGALTALMLAASCFAQLLLLRADVQTEDAQPAGLMLLVAGVGALVLAFPLHSVAAMLIAAILAGGGLGVALFGAQTDVNRLAPPQRRGEVTAAFLTCLYGSVAVTSTATGLLADAYGLSTAVIVAGAALSTVAAVATGWHLRARGEADGLAV
jgi:hypothetical protein